MTNPNILRYFRFKEEAVTGIAETVPEMTVDVEEIDPGIPKKPDMEYRGNIGRDRRSHRAGGIVFEPSLTSGTDIKMLARMLYFFCGEKITVDAEGDNSGLDPDSVLYYDSSGSSFSNKTTAFKDASVNDVAVPGHAAGEVGDYLAIGNSETFELISFVIGTSRTDTSTLVWEYWDGDGWVTLTATDNTTAFTVAPGTATVTWTAPADWTKEELSTTDPYYWVRVRCSAFSSAGVAGAITSGTISKAPDIRTDYIYGTDNMTLPSFTGWFGLDIGEYILTGCTIDKLELNSEDEYLTIAPEMYAQNYTTDDLEAKTTIVAALNDDYPLAFYEVDVHMRSINSLTAWGTTTKISQNVNKIKIKAENGIDDKLGKGQGSRTNYSFPAGQRTYDIEFDHPLLDSTWIDYLWGDSDGPDDREGSTEFEMMIEIDAGIYGNAELYFPRCIVTSYPMSASKREPMVPTIAVEAYSRTINIPTAEPTPADVAMLATVVRNYPDTTGAVDAPTETA